MSSFFTGRVVVIDYTNWRGVRRKRRIVPQDIRFGRSDWHPSDQWLMAAVDAETGSPHEFAMVGIHSWSECADQALGWRT